MQFDLVNQDGEPMLEKSDLEGCLKFYLGWKEEKKIYGLPDPFPYALYGYDGFGNEALYFEEYAAANFLEEILSLADYFTAPYR